ncbi:hypothetical protein Pan241w_60060 [Gimesia alba]|uniref:Uncharacterized protein n=1 Tax=Gimesia alba TaxID=2527973 RepID=A0A517RPS0_9PLAN|nr:hypothetical protein [Gimesia alba]QDT45878.1 hypothetical protein Pan241w_60060 [Gimesia alba]
MITQPLKNTAAVFAILAGLISLPLTWMTISGVQLNGQLVNGDLGNPISFPFPIGNINVTGFNGHITLFIKTPIWLVISIAIVANVLQLMHKSVQFAVPHFAQWLTALFGFTWISMAICVVLFSDKAGLGIGSLLGLFCAAVALICLVIPTSTQQDLQLES